MRRPVVSLLLLILLMLLSSTGAALGQSLPETTYASPTECYGCHAVGGYAASAPVDFASAATVDRNACKQCHGPIPFAWWDDHAHNGESYCGPFCHAQGTQPTFSEPAGTVIERLVLTPYGRFQSLTSPNASAATVHAAHTGNGWVAATFDSIDPWCLTCHGATSCSACHTAAVAHGSHGDSPSCTAAGCHTLSGSDPAVPGCVDCHPDGQQETHAVSHAATDGSLEGIACTSCHDLALLAEHSKSTSSTSASSCAACHPQPADSTSPSWDGTCATAGCHTLGSSAPMHAQTTDSHAVSTANEMCLDCHEGAELGSVHAGAEDPADGSVSCLVCHKPSSPPATGDCTECHFTFGEHYDPAAHASPTFSCGGAGCHDVLSGLMAVHDERNGEFDCWGCHNSVRSEVQSAIDNGLTGCGDCHSSMTATGGHRSVHWPTPLLSDASGPHYSYYTGSAGDAPTNDCIGCHTQNLVDEHMGITDAGTGLIIRLPRLDSSGTTLTCDTCHGQPEGSAVRLAIADGMTSCESCHSVHGPMQLVHDSSFIDVQEVPCADCHSADLRSEHNGTYTSSAGLTGCDVCHALYDGELAVRVQSAISAENDTRCSACHEAYHTDTASHDAAAAASLECGGCHAPGRAVIDVTAVHGGTAGCPLCHSASARTGSIGTHTADCSSCHAIEGTEYHRNMEAGHTFSAMDPGCLTCHQGSLPTEHQPYLARYPEYDTTCQLCHNNADPARVPAGATADCASCHEVHGDIETLHTAVSSDGCVRCHTSADLRVVHAGSPEASCGVCHNELLALEGKSAECITCHFDGEGGVSFHTSMSARHLGLGTSGTCEGAGCHPSRDVTVIHERFVGPGRQFSQYEDTCALCHLNEDAARIDWASIIDGTCANCHGWPHDRMNHVADSDKSAECAGCHDDWVPATHDADPNSGGAYSNCDTCHNNPLAGDLTWMKSTSDCEGCHDKWPAAEKHYPAERHLTTHESPCTWCHYQDLKAEHAQSSVAVTCAECHTVGASVISAGWNKTCEECHRDMHADKPTKHASARADCSTSGCHLADAAAIHGSLPGAGCQVCHTSVEQSSVSKNCTDSACHGSAYHAGLPASHTASASAECTRCHEERLDDGSQLAPIHSACSTCHNTSLDLSTKTAECATCHAVSGTDYHSSMSGKHTFGGMDSSCQRVGCHASTLPEEHAEYLTRYPQYSDSCAMCHLNEEPGRIPAGATADCADCHTIHGDIDGIHTSSSSQSCVECHETPFTLSIHTKADGTPDCDICHSAPAGRIDWSVVTIECGSCHGALSPVDPNHYPLAPHDASAETACNQCHYKDMKLEHFKPTVAVTCVACHEDKVDALAVPWDKTCSACHPTKHGEQNAKHASSIASCGTAATGCHDIADAAAIHTKPTGPGCAACHAGPSTPATTTACTDAGCHASVGTDHKGLHEAASVNPNGCSGCHFMNLVDEHSALGLTCGTCHDDAAYASVIASGDLRCRSCHPGLHSTQDWEFNPGRASVHRVSADLPGMRSSFSVNGTTYSWSLPSASTFLKSGWTTSSMMGCSDCHSYTGATGPHGATMQVKIDPAYPNPLRIAPGSSTIVQLSPNSPTGMSTRDGGSTPAGVICEKCHDLSNSGSWSNIVHKEHDDRGSEGGYCNHCHVGVPHGWSRPRLIGYRTDPAQYATASGGITRISLKSYSPNGWSKSDCGAGCSSGRHPLSGTSWPGTTTAPTTGNLGGTISSSSGGAVAGASVSVGGMSATSGATGAYAVNGLAAGTHTMTVSAAGYTAWTGQVTVAANATTTQNVVLTPAAQSSSNLARSGTATASSAYGSNYSASRAIDGSTSTYWRSSSGGTQWLRVDLGAAKTVTKIVVNWYDTRYARAYRLESSADGTNWTQHYSTTSGTGGVNTITLPSAANARYVRITCTVPNDSNYRIREFEVWGY